MIYKTLHRKLKIEQQKPHYKPGINSGAPELCRNYAVTVIEQFVRQAYVPPKKTITDTKNNIYNILSRKV